MSEWWSIAASMIVEVVQLKIMKNNPKRLTYVLILMSALVVFLLWESSRNQTQISIVSASPGQDATDGNLTVRYRVHSGADDFTIIVLPDTQHYSDEFPE